MTVGDVRAVAERPCLPKTMLLTLTSLPQLVRRVPEIPIGLQAHPELGLHLEESRQT